jgi:hypothetical protein
MMDRTRHPRNIAIVLLLAAIVTFLPGAGRAARTFEAVLQAAFAAGIGYFAYRLYRERQLSIYGLGERYRAVLYGALGLTVVVLAAKQRLWETGLGTFIWFVLVGLIAYALIATYRFWRTY